MAEPDNIVLDHLKAIRSEMAAVRDDIRKLDDKVGDLNVGQHSIQGVTMAGCHSLYVLDHRVESLEQTIGGIK